MPTLPKEDISLWRESVSRPKHQQLKEDINVDTVVIGAGITGLTTAYLLKKAGQKVAVLDKYTVGAGTTGRTTGKVSSLHNLFYADISDKVSFEAAKVYGRANQAAVEKIKEIINEEIIDCDWSDVDNYVFTTDEKEVNRLQQEVDTANKIGLPASITQTSSLPFEIKAAIKFTGQGKMNAHKYVTALAECVNGEGSHVYENAKITSIRDGALPTVSTRHGIVRAKDIVVATGPPTLPLAARGSYCFLEYPRESYIVAGETSQDILGTYISPDDNHYSVFPFELDGKKMVLIGGEGNISGVRVSKDAKYKKLASYAQKHFGVDEITHKWCDRDYLSYDELPLIGKMYPWSEHLYVGTAFRKWGLTNGTVAGMILSDTILGNDNPWASTFDSTRTRPVKSIPKVALNYLTGNN